MQEKKIYCNRCGKPICLEEEVPKADYLRIEKNWGYFSNKDGIHQKVNICEKCCDDLIKEFQIPPSENQIIELL